MVRNYIQNQEREDRRLDQLNIFRQTPPQGGAWFSTALSGSQVFKPPALPEVMTCDPRTPPTYEVPSSVLTIRNLRNTSLTDVMDGVLATDPD